MLRTCNEHPWFPLHAAVMVGDIDAARGVLQHFGPGALTTTGGCSFRTPFMVALRSGQCQCARWLYRHLSLATKNMYKTDSSAAFKLLSLTVRSANNEVLAWLLDEVVDLAATITRDRCGREDVFKLLAAIFARYSDDAARTQAFLLVARTPYLSSMSLSAAAMKQCDAVVAALGGSGAVLAAPDHEYLVEGMPPGLYVGMVRMLMECCGGLACFEMAPRDLLMHAVVVGAPELMELLLRNGALDQVHQNSVCVHGKATESNKSVKEARNADVSVPAGRIGDAGRP